MVAEPLVSILGRVFWEPALTQMPFSELLLLVALLAALVHIAFREWNLVDVKFEPLGICYELQVCWSTATSRP